MRNSEKPYRIFDAPWDSDFFHVKAAKTVLDKRCSESDMILLKKEWNQYDFVMIQNTENDAMNNVLLGTQTQAYLVDVNVQFVMSICEQHKDQNNFIKSTQGVYFQEPQNQMAQNDEYVRIIENGLQYSKFFNDSNIGVEKGKELYANWVRNSFLKDEKWFVSATDGKNVLGVLLFNKCADVCTIELVAVEKQFTGKKIGSGLLRKLVEFCCNEKVSEIHVGTQIDNLSAIGYYLKNGFQVTHKHSCYHLWNK
ncbi:MAG: GNAT family N-acetyltransferase [Christensenellaceae bacterium]